MFYGYTEMNTEQLQTSFWCFILHVQHCPLWL